MADRPIIFSAPMIRALLADRKTQTRRLAKVQIYDHVNPRFSQLRAHREGGGWRIYGSEPASDPFKVSYAIGDRLYVREAWAPLDALTHSDPGAQALAERGFYRADGSTVDGEISRWRPSIHMTRWASRLTLLVTDVRVERLQDISEGDAAAEGVERESADLPFYYVPGIWPHSITAVGVEEPGGRHAARSFAKLWDHINGPESWQANPWVVAITFTVHARNIDQLAPIAEVAA
ncbi:hypothetical protein SB2_07480 [Methylobacterium radiotolerans]|nr:hypothetical protein SB3_06340 [Methylobacterium radiotolerans]KTS48830.1 hypothetical protein SB2_07480 [Methylobacterium radiotolerans]